MKKALIQLHVAVFLAGFTAILGELIGLNEGWLVWYRMLITGITLLVLLYANKQLQPVSKQQLLQLTGVGGIVAIHWVSFYGSVKYANVSVAVVCISGSGFFTAFLEPLINRRPIRVIELLLGLLAIAGIYIIFDFHPQFKTGILFGVVSALGSSLFPIFNKRLLATIQPRTLTMYEMLGGWVVLSLVLPLYIHLFPEGYAMATASDWGWLLLLAWVCTVLCFDLQLNALKFISPFTANLAYNLEPVYGIVLAFVFLQENKHLNSQFYAGVGLIILAVVLQMARVMTVSGQSKRGN